MADVETGIVEADETLLQEAQEMFELCRDADTENRNLQLDDLRFTKLQEQWPLEVVNQRRLEGRPCLTLDKTQAFIRQVVNEVRMNKPQIKVKPVDGGADPETAEVLAGLIRNIEYSSDGDVARDTAADYAISSGRGYYRINTRYASDDTFDQDLIIERVANPLTVWGDPYSTAADSSDWMMAFVVDMLSEDAFKKRFPNADAVDWEGYCNGMGESWFDGDQVMVAEYWKREEVQSEAFMLEDGRVVKADVYEVNEGFPNPETRQPTQILARRPIKTFKVTMQLCSGKEVLETTDWPGTYIPIIPVYGDEFNVDGRRWFSSLIRPVKDAQRNYNYWRTSATELVALAPKAPWIGKERAFSGDDAAKWATANSVPHAFISVPDNAELPQRQPFAGVPVGNLQEALNASDDMKAILGIYDASLGARSNETSGVAINARKVEGDVSTFHFIDNLSRAMKHEGRVLIDLIPHVYNTMRIVRTLGPEGEPQSVQIGDPQAIQEAMQKAQMQHEEIGRIYDLSTGKYDVAVETGPSFTTQREEGNAALLELVRNFPQAAPVLAGLILKTFDFPGSTEAAEAIERMQQAQQGQQGDPAQAAKDQADAQAKAAELQIKAQEAANQAAFDREKLSLDIYKAETDRMKVAHEISQPTKLPRNEGVQ